MLKLLVNGFRNKRSRSERATEWRAFGTSAFMKMFLRIFRKMGRNRPIEYADDSLNRQECIRPLHVRLLFPYLSWQKNIEDKYNSLHGIGAQRLVSERFFLFDDLSFYDDGQ